MRPYPRPQKTEKKIKLTFSQKTSVFPGIFVGLFLRILGKSRVFIEMLGVSCSWLLHHLTKPFPDQPKDRLRLKRRKNSPRSSSEDKQGMVLLKPKLTGLGVWAALTAGSTGLGGKAWGGGEAGRPWSPSARPASLGPPPSCVQSLEA